jgi:hypothetical protein
MTNRIRHQQWHVQSRDGHHSGWESSIYSRVDVDGRWDGEMSIQVAVQSPMLTTMEPLTTRPDSLHVKTVGRNKFQRGVWNFIASTAWTKLPVPFAIAVDKPLMPRVTWWALTSVQPPRTLHSKMKMLVLPLVSLVHTLPLLAMAVSFGGSPRSRGFSIPIHKRGPSPMRMVPLTTHVLQSNIRLSLASVHSAVFQLLYTSLTQHLSKVEDGFSAYERNTGERHPLDRLPYMQEKRDMGSVPLSPADQQLWYGSISVGTPAKSFLGAPRLFLSLISSIDEHQWISTRGAAICSYPGHSVEKPAPAMLCTTRLRAIVRLTPGEVSTLSLAMAQPPLSRDTPTSSPLRGCP